MIATAFLTASPAREKAAARPRLVRRFLEGAPPPRPPPRVETILSFPPRVAPRLPRPALARNRRGSTSPPTRRTSASIYSARSSQDWEGNSSSGSPRPSSLAHPARRRRRTPRPGRTSPAVATSSTTATSRASRAFPPPQPRDPRSVRRPPADPGGRAQAPQTSLTPFSQAPTRRSGCACVEPLLRRQRPGVSRSLHFALGVRWARRLENSPVPRSPRPMRSRDPLDPLRRTCPREQGRYPPEAQGVPASAVASYYKEPLVVASAKGKCVCDIDGREYLDFFGGILTVDRALRRQGHREAGRQIERLGHVSTLYPTVPVVELAERLARITPGACRRASSSPPAPTPTTRRWSLAQVHTKRAEIIALRHAYTGRSRSVTGHAPWRPCRPRSPSSATVSNPYCYRCPFGLTYPGCELRCAKDLDDLIQTTTTGRIAAFMAEPIQGVGGFITPPKSTSRSWSRSPEARRRLHLRRGADRLRPHRETGSASSTGASSPTS